MSSDTVKRDTDAGERDISKLAPIDWLAEAAEETQMPHANSWRTCGGPPLDNPAYEEEVDPMPDEEDYNHLEGELRLAQEKLKNRAVHVGYLERRCALLQNDVEELRRERDEWHLLAVKRG